MADEASTSFLTACVLSDEMPSALDEMAVLAGGDGAVLVYSHNNVPINATASASIVEPIAAYVHGDRPVDPRIAKVNPAPDEGFRLDQDDFSLREIGRDPFYQEFLKPWGFGWHACARLGGSSGGDSIHLSIKRRLDRGPFSREDVAAIAAQLPMLRSAVKFTQMPAPITAPIFGRLSGDHRRITIGFNALGQAFEVGQTARDQTVLTIREGAVVCANPRHQPTLDGTVEQTPRLSQPTALILTGIDGARWSFRMRRWSGAPLGPHGPIAFIAVVSALDYLEEPPGEWLEAARALFGLSAAEARIAALIAQGVSVPQVAQRLTLSPGTVRNHLKAVFTKTGAARQVELSVLLPRM